MSFNVARVPRSIDLVVGISPGGVMAASMLALTINRPFCDLASLLENRVLSPQGRRRDQFPDLRVPADAHGILLLDDCVDSASTMQAARDLVAGNGYTANVTTAAVYATVQGQSGVDIFLESFELPGVFAWNLFHSEEIAHYCVDIDGVLCIDPTTDENDDGPRYLQFLQDTTPTVFPSHRIGHLVTSRLEKYREATEAWLRIHGIDFEQLHMLDLPSAAERRRLRVHAGFKASVYKSLDDARLFIESEPPQAQQIAFLSGKPVLDYTSQIIAEPREPNAQSGKGLGALRKRVVAKVRRAVQ